MSLEIEQFNPTVTELNALVATAGLLKLPDPRDEAQLRVIKDKRLQLRDARVAIEKKGKELRQQAIDFQKAVIGKEKELIAIIEPEEDRLKALEDAAKEIALMDKRRKDLPVRMEKLKTIGDEVVISEEEVLKMDDDAFTGHYNERVTNKNAADTAALNKREDDLKKKEDDAKREEETKKREEKARQDERERLEKEQKDKEEKARKDKEEKERLDKEEKERLEKEEKYQAFLKEHGYSEETKEKFTIVRNGKEVKLFMLTGTFIQE